MVGVQHYTSQRFTKHSNIIKYKPQSPTLWYPSFLKNSGGSARKVRHNAATYRPVGYMKYFLCHSMNILFESPKNILKNCPAVVLNFSRYFSKKAVNRTHITVIHINRHFLPLTLQDCARWHWMILQRTKLIFSHLQSCICDKANPALQPAETTSSSEKQQKKQRITQNTWIPTDQPT